MLHRLNTGARPNIVIRGRSASFFHVFRPRSDELTCLRVLRRPIMTGKIIKSFWYVSRGGGHRCCASAIPPMRAYQIMSPIRPQNTSSYFRIAVLSQIISFYSKIAEVILPHLRDPAADAQAVPGRNQRQHFYEKNAPSHTPSWMKRFAVPRSEGGSEILRVVQRSRNARLGDEPGRYRKARSTGRCTGPQSPHLARFRLGSR
jgi:hypothetical protein